MAKPKPRVSKYKENRANELVELLKKYPIIGILDMRDLPAKQLQLIRRALGSTCTMFMTKRRLMAVAIEKVKKEQPSIEKIVPFLGGMPALLFTNEDPFILAKTIKKNQSSAAIKAGQIAPEDLIAKAGPTSFAPGPVIGELGALGIKASIDAGKVKIVKDSVVAKKGDIIDDKRAAMLARLGVEPMRIGLNLVAVYNQGEIIEKEVLFVNEQEYIDKLAMAHSEAVSLAMQIVYITPETIKPLLNKAHTQVRSLALKANILTSETVKDILAKANAEAQALQSKVEV
ncbi:MAG: 50S ribosomal protein L10 [Candidatus Woesearchaeota archaeon]